MLLTMERTDQGSLELQDSILRRLPPGLNGHQLIALDVVSNARDIISLTGQRLTSTLTWIALEKEVDSVAIALAFADAWSIVDAVDRIRSMVRLLAKHLHPTFKEAEARFDKATQSVRELRNLTDHLPQRIDSVLSSNMPALGRLSWVTVTSVETALLCTLDPGTIRTKRKSVALPTVGGRSVVVPTGAIQLSAGNSNAWLDEAAVAVHSLVGLVEAHIEHFAREQNLVGVEAGRNLLAVAEISFSEQIAVPFDHPQLSLF